MPAKPNIQCKSRPPAAVGDPCRCSLIHRLDQGRIFDIAMPCLTFAEVNVTANTDPAADTAVIMAEAFCAVSELPNNCLKNQASQGFCLMVHISVTYPWHVEEFEGIFEGEDIGVLYSKELDISHLVLKEKKLSLEPDMSNSLRQCLWPYTLFQPHPLQE